MKYYPQVGDRGSGSAVREEFADGSAVITYANGTMLILESRLSKACVVQEGRAVNYNDPPPPPPAAGDQST